MTAVGDVVGPKSAANPGRNRLLADAQVHEPVHLVRARELAHPLLEHTDPPHRLEEREARACVGPAHLTLHRGYAATGDEPSTR